MKKVILFGATGHIGKAIAHELIHRGYELTVVIRNENQARLFPSSVHFRVGDACSEASLHHFCSGQEIVISALGKSVSPNDMAKPTFQQVDFEGNMNILKEARRSGIRKFVYVSALHAEKYLHLEYFRVHHEFSEALKRSGIDYAIIKPPAVFSAFLDLMDMARKGRLVHIGAGDKKTNPIYEGDLAKVCVDAITASSRVIEAGGKAVYQRRQLNEIIQNTVDPGKKIRTVPIGLVKSGLPLIKLFNRNLYDKMAFFTEVMQHDTIAPLTGDATFEWYIKENAGK